MPCCRPNERHRRLLLIVLAENIVFGNFLFALDYLVDRELDLKMMDASLNVDGVRLASIPRRRITGTMAPRRDALKSRMVHGRGKETTWKSQSPTGFAQWLLLKRMTRSSC